MRLPFCLTPLLALLVGAQVFAMDASVPSETAAAADGEGIAVGFGPWVATGDLTDTQRAVVDGYLGHVHRTDAATGFPEHEWRFAALDLDSDGVDDALFAFREGNDNYRLWEACPIVGMRLDRTGGWSAFLVGVTANMVTVVEPRGDHDYPDLEIELNREDGTEARRYRMGFHDLGYDRFGHYRARE